MPRDHIERNTMLVPLYVPVLAGGNSCRDILKTYTRGSGWRSETPPTTAPGFNSSPILIPKAKTGVWRPPFRGHQIKI